MDRALDAARQAASAGEVPVGALLVHEAGEILATAGNAPCALHDPTAHAEIRVLREGGARLGNYRLEHTVLVVTLEPCFMCTGALIHARVAGLVFGAADSRAGAVLSCLDGLAQPFHNHHPWYMGGVRSEHCATLLRSFFRTRAEEGPH